jgi:LPS-assembly lipoprotein
MSSLKRASLLALALAIGACGFHRLGVTPMSPMMRATRIDAKDARTDFQLELRRSLVASGSRVVESAEEATATLNITRDETGRRVLSVSARNTPREYEVYYTVTYSVKAGEREILSSQTLTLTRDYGFDEERQLAKEEEEDILRLALARDLAGIVMRRLASL